MRHFVYDGNLHLYLSSTKAVFKDDEITLPLDFGLKERYFSSVSLNFTSNSIMYTVVPTVMGYL